MPEPIQLTPEQEQEYAAKAASVQPVSGAPIDPIKDLDAASLADLAAKDPSFSLTEEFSRNKNLWSDPELVQKVADAYHQTRQRGFQVSDLPGPKKILGTAADIAKGFGKQAWNYAQATIGTPLAGMVGEITGQRPGFQTALAEEGQRQIAENIAGTEQAVTQLGQMAARAGEKVARGVGVAKPLAEYSPQEKVKALFDAVGQSQTREDIARGHGGFMTPVGGEVVKELEAAGKPVRPEETEALSSGDPFSWWAFGKAFQGASRAVPTGVSRAAKEFTEAAGEKAATLGGKAISSLGLPAEVIGKATEAAAPVVKIAAPIAVAGKALIEKQLPSLEALLGGGFVIKHLEDLGKAARGFGERASKFGEQVGGAAPVESAPAQLTRDVLTAVPEAAGEAAKGAAFDIGTAAATAETPQDTQGVGLGTVFGALGAGRRVGGRVLSGQLIGPRRYGINIPQPSSGQFPGLDAMHNQAFASAEPGVRARLNAIRQFARGAAPGTDVFLGGDDASISDALQKQGVSKENADKWAEQSGFFTTDLTGRDGKSRRVILVKNPDAAPHEAFHAIQDVLGEEGNRAVDQVVRQEYGPQWDAEGNTYARRLAGGDLAGATWQEKILDLSGWGQIAAKEKVYQDISNRMRAETGAEPRPSDVQALAEHEFGRRMDASLARNPNLSPEEAQSQMWRDVLSPEEANATADRYLARELAAENFDAVFKRSPELVPDTGLLNKFSRTVGKLVYALGGEPLAGRQTQIGEIQPKFAVTEAVRGAIPTAPSTPAPAAPPPRPAIVTATTTAADKALDYVNNNPSGVPERDAGAHDIINALQQNQGIRVLYWGAKGTPAGEVTSVRPERRAEIEAQRGTENEKRQLVEKEIFPYRIDNTSKGPQFVGWSPDNFDANVAKLGEWLGKLSGAGHDVTAQVPYEFDPATGQFTEKGMADLKADAQTFMRNQAAGFTGSGKPLVVPKEVTGRGFFAPETAGTPEPLDQGRADVINYLFHTQIPETVSRVAPLHLAAQEVATATGRPPVLPVRPRGEYTPAQLEKAKLAAPRAPLEVNPFRQWVEQTAQDTKLDRPSLIDVSQRLNFNHIEKTTPGTRPEPFKANVLTLAAGFQPPPLPENFAGRPVAESARDIVDMTPENWQRTVSEYKGDKLGGGLTGFAWDLGSQARTPADVQALRDAFSAVQTKIDEAKRTGDIDARFALAGRGQAIREAYEAATGENFEGTNAGSAVASIRKYFVPDYQPPVPGKRFSGQAQPKQLKEISDLAEKYAEENGIDYKPPTGYVPYNRDLGKRLAAFYDEAVHAPDNPDVQKSYNAFKAETLAQYKAITDAGYDLEPLSSANTPYKGGADVMRDVEQNKHMFFNTSDVAFGQPGQGETQLMLEPTGVKAHGRELSYNDMFRAVHDFFAHAKESFSFGPRGEFNAWREHAAMYSSEAQGALGAETIGQTAWTQLNQSLLNRQGELLRPGEPGFVPRSQRPFAEQKNIVLPSELISEAKGQAQPKPVDEAKLYKPGVQGGFKKMWILPNGRVTQLGAQWHSDWLDENRDEMKKFGLKKSDIPPFEGTDNEARTNAMKKGFGRVNYSVNTGLMTIEVRADDWPKLKDSVRRIVSANIDDIDRLRINLLDPDAEQLQDGKTVSLFDYNTDREKLNAIPFMTEAPRATVKATETPAFRAPEEPEEPLPPVYEKPEFAVYDKTGTFVGKYQKYDDAERAAGKGGSVRILKKIAGQAQSGPIQRRTPGWWLRQGMGVKSAPAVEETAQPKTYVIRHGSTDYNNEQDPTKDLIRGHLDVPLNEEGRQEARDTAKQLANSGIQKIYASDLDRTMETATKIQDTTGAPVVPDERLRPWKFGPTIEGKPTADVQPKIQELIENPDERPEGGESFNEFKDRFLTAYHDIQDAHPDENTAIVTHYRGTRLLDAWRKAGVDNDQVDLADMEENRKRPPGAFSVIDKKGNEVYSPAVQAQPAYFVHMKDRNKMFPGEEAYGPFATEAGAKEAQKMILKTAVNTGSYHVSATVTDNPPKGVRTLSWEDYVTVGGTKKYFDPDLLKLAGQAQPKQFSDPDFEKSLANIRDGKAFGQTFNPDGSIWAPPPGQKNDIVSLASVNVPQADLDKETVVSGLAPYSDLLNNPNVAAGIFAFDKGGKPTVSIDVNAVVDQKHRDNTLKFARDNDQVAIWDSAKSEEVPAGGSGDTRLKTPEQISSALENLTQGKPVDIKAITGQAQPSAELFEQEPTEAEPAAKRTLSSVEVSRMSNKELEDYYPEAVVPKNRKAFLRSDLRASPLAKQAGSEEAAIKAFGNKLVDFAKQNEDKPEFQAGLKWYSEFVPMLKKEFRNDAPMMAELIAATSPQNPPDTNYAYAVDALEGYKSGRFDKLIEKYEEGLRKLDDGSWKDWAAKEGLGENATPAAYMAQWIEEFDLKPRKANGKLYGISSVPVLQVLARRWLKDATGLKTKNFVQNLLGTGHEATIDIWADRTMRRLGYEGFVDRWRILPMNAGAPNDNEFRFAQKSFRAAAKQMGMKPDELQAGLWFAEKKLWGDKGWSRLDYGDYRKEIPKTGELRAKAQEQMRQGLVVEPRNLNL